MRNLDLVWNVLGAAALGAIATVSLQTVIKERYEYDKLECVDQFARQTFTTNENVLNVVDTATDYRLLNTDGSITIITKTPNMVCRLSRNAD